PGAGVDAHPLLREVGGEALGIEHLEEAREREVARRRVHDLVRDRAVSERRRDGDLEERAAASLDDDGGDGTVLRDRRERQGQTRPGEDDEGGGQGKALHLEHTEDPPWVSPGTWMCTVRPR